MSTANFSNTDDEDDPFLVTSSLEILSVLRSIESRRALLRMHVEGREVAIITTILEIDAASNSFIVDNSADEDFNRRITSAELVNFDTNIDKVRIQFSTAQVTGCMQDGMPALRVPIPDSLQRIQRREYYRVDIPVSNRASATFTIRDDKGERTVKFELKDISAGGISVFDNTHVLDNALGTLYRDCRIELPEAGVVVTDLMIMRSLDEILLNGKESRLIGCRFFELSNPMNFIVQQYIGKLERKLNAKRRGFE
ncbi:flagellar brake protein [Candidimonas sp. SYP-B2681]|uniref:flagellar brake protein n=1 Tax=Candidimonas sp. SYP-B2681 TaxID=2497686 RepID=UPI000F89A633|nr:flagellar brake protein [Candidimonas sp. SYP-B2681]RTZ39977.1 flagellar brake protein [Candidimonas sp. SYP-B2681]